MDNISGFLHGELLSHGAELAGFGNLTELPPEQRAGLPFGVAVAVAYPKDVIKGIANGPTAEYHEHYNRLNEKLDRLVTLGAEVLQSQGYIYSFTPKKHSAHSVFCRHATGRNLERR